MQAALDRGRGRDEHPRIPGQAAPEGVRIAGSDGRVVLKADEAKTAAGELDGPIWVVKAQIHAGGRGKGRFKEASAGEKGGVRSRSRCPTRPTRPRRCSAAPSSPTSPARPARRSTASTSRTGGHRARALPGAADRPGVEPDRLRLLDRRRHGHRGGGGPHAGEGADLHRRPGLGHLRLPRPPRRLRARARGPPSQAVRRPDQQALPAVHREGRRDAGDQPADRHGGRRPQVPRRQDGVRSTRSTARRTSSACATRQRRTRRSWRPRSSTSTTSRSTARSAAWSTAPASPWRRWT